MAPLASRRGFAPGADVVTAHAGKGQHAFADGNTADERELVALIAKTVAFPLGNAFHGSADRGETVLLVNPVWAERFQRSFGGLDVLQAELHAHAWQPLDQWPASGRRLLEERGRVDERGRVAMHARPEQFVVVVCGGMGNLHAVALPTWGDSISRSEPVVVPATLRGGTER